MMLRYGSVLTSLWSLRGAAQIAAVQPTEAGVRYHGRVHRGIAPLADIYIPDQPTGASVVLVHGGGFVIGSRTMKPMRYLTARLVAAGIAVCAIDYRMIFRGGRLAEAVDDVGAALAFWSAHSARRGLDPKSSSVVGLSAGATLALLAAARADAGSVHRLVCCFGLYDVDHLQSPLASVLPTLLFGTTDRTAWCARSPARVVQPEMPTLLLHGSEDGLVPVEQARRVAAAREVLGLPTRLVIYEGAPHGFFNVPGTAAESGAREIIAHVTL